MTGTDFFTYKANDGTDDSNIASVAFLAIDTLPPELAIDLVDSPINLNTLTITGRREEQAIITAEGTAVLSDVEYPTSFTWETTASGLTEGANTITISAEDRTGNYNRKIITISVDTLPPSINIDSVVTPTNLTFQSISGEKEAGAIVTVTTDRGASIGEVSYPDATKWSVMIDGLLPGANVVTATAKDAASNTTSVWKIIDVVNNRVGDCDGDGKISINEVQAAINMYLGLLPPAACVNPDGEGSVSIVIIQKIINGYLGL